jgi:hypothetical protein
MTTFLPGPSNYILNKGKITSNNVTDLYTVQKDGLTTAIKHVILPNAAVTWCAPLLHIQDILVLILGTQTSYHD